MIRQKKKVDNEQRTEALRSRHVPALLLSYALPAVVGTSITAMYNIVDRIFIGQGVGEYAIAGLTLTFPIMIFLQAFGMLVGAGASVRVSILLGMEDKKGAECILANAIMLTFLLAVLTCVPSYLFMEPLLTLFGASSRTMPYALDYLGVIIPGSIFSTMSFSYNAVMRASGYPTKAMLYMIVGAVLNVLLDALFIYGCGWGIRGAAWATVIAMFITMLFVMQHFLDKDSLIRFRRSAMKMSWRMIISIMSIGMAPFTLNLVSSAVAMLLNRSFVYYGDGGELSDLAIGAYGIINSFAMLSVMLVLGISQGMQPIVGFNFGSGNYDRVLYTYKLGVKINSAITLVGFLFALLTPRLLYSLFTQSQSMIAIGEPAMRMAMGAFLFVGFQITTTQLFQSIGMSGKAMFLSLSRQVIFLIPLLLILPQLFGIDGVWMAMPISDFIAAVITFVMVTHYIKRLKRERS